jgi:DNA-binding NtrC family response regulator
MWSLVERNVGVGHATVVVMDTADDIREVLELMLKHEGYSVYSFASPEDVLCVSKSVKVDLFLIDMTKPGTEGIDCLRMLMVDEKPYEAVMLSQREDVEGADMAARLGAFACLAKPFSFNELVTMVEYALASSAAKRNNMQENEKNIEKQCRG